MTLVEFKAATLEKFSALSERPGSADWPAFDCPESELVTLITYLKDECQFDMLVDATALDNGVEESPRFTVINHLYSTTRHMYVRVATDCEDDENPESPTLVPLFDAANWHERECFDMFGIRFTDHPDMRRILMWDEYPYYPLRKDFPLAGFETELNDDEVAEVTGTKVIPAPMAGGPFVSPQTSGDMAAREPKAKDESWSEAQEKPTS